MTAQKTDWLQRRILLFSMLGILFTGLVVGLATGVPLYLQGRQYSEDALHSQVHGQAQSIAQFFGKLADVAMQLTSRSVIRDRLEQYNRGAITQAELVAFSAPRLQDALGQSSDVVGLVRLDAAGEPAVLLGLQPPRADWPLPPAQAHAPLIHGPVLINDAPYLLIGAPILNRQSERVGTDIVVFQLDTLLKLLVDKAAFGMAARQYLGDLSQAAVLTTDTQASQLSLLPAEGSLHQVLQLAGAGYTGMLAVDDSDRILFHEPVPGFAGWGLAVSVRGDDLYLPVQQQLLLPALTILLMLVTGTLLTARLIRPLGSEVVKTSRALAESEQRLRTLINATPDIICFKDGQGRWLEANQADLELFSLVGVDYQGKTDAELADFTDPLYRAAFLACEASDEQAWHAGGVSRGEEAIPTVRGETHIYDVIKVPVFGPAGGRKGLVVLGRDVTERRRAELALQQSAQEWSYAMDFFEDAVYLLDLDDRVLRANRAFYRLFNLAAEQVIGHDIAELMHPHGEKKECPICRARRLREDAYVTMDADDPSNPVGRPIETSIRIIRDEAGEPIGILMGIKDLTRARQTEEQLRLAASVFEGSQEGIMILGPDHRIVDVNQAFGTITGYSAEAVAGRLLREVLSTEQVETLSCERLWALVDAQGSWQGEVWYRRSDGEVFPAWQNLSVVKDAQGEPTRYIGVFTDISEKKAAEERINHLAHFDLLTDLPNRVLLQDRLQNALERMRRSGQPLAVLFLDLDRFKNVNDSLGHPVGDRLLQVVAHRLNAVVRDQDTVARLGGDEFLLILEDLHDPQHAGVVARKILERLSEPARVDQHDLYIGASIGISIFPNDGTDSDVLIKNADTAMYRAKEMGRNNYQFYTPELTRLSLERFELECGLRQALEREELLLHYQPQATLHDARCIGAEALVRWQHPEKGLIPPDRFIPLAEETGLIQALGRWVLRTACKQAKRWQEQGRPLRIAVNLSGQQIVHGDIVATVSEVLGETGLDPRWLELEITEGFVLSHAETGVRTLERLKALGITLAIDDFGTGYSSLSYLKRLPVDRLKIDRSFVQGVPGDRDDAAIVATIIAMARSLQLEVIAEGVETAVQLAFLREQGCDEYQGYLLGRPLPLAEFERMLPQ
ncbi:MAG: EAL domain-containing protein [Pseudomonadota bacterium]